MVPCNVLVIPRIYRCSQTHPLNHASGRGLFNASFDVYSAHRNVVLCGVRFCHEVREVAGARGPDDLEVFLPHAIANPVKTHVDGF